jgi:hypothetical protein
LQPRFGDLFFDFKGNSPWAVLYGVLGLTHTMGTGVLTAIYIGALA